MKILFGDVVLVRGTEFLEEPINLKVSGNRSVQILSTIRGSEIKAIDRGNLSTNFEFRVRKKHENSEDAQNYTMRHASELENLQSDLSVISEPSNTIYYLRDAVISGIVSSINGNVSEHFYKIIGGGVSSSLNN